MLYAMYNLRGTDKNYNRNEQISDKCLLSVVKLWTLIEATSLQNITITYLSLLIYFIIISNAETVEMAVSSDCLSSVCPVIRTN